MPGVSILYTWRRKILLHVDEKLPSFRRSQINLRLRPRIKYLTYEKILLILHLLT